ncbi:hypothetical protein WK36_30500 [Burkholderia cepacia]|nr:hypothetical protein WK36_30500 [Burkholderia cepacia]
MRAASFRACGRLLPVRTVAPAFACGQAPDRARPRTFAPASAAIGAAAMVRVHPSVESVLLHPIRHSHTQP